MGFLVSPPPLKVLSEFKTSIPQVGWEDSWEDRAAADALQVHSAASESWRADSTWLAGKSPFFIGDTLPKFNMEPENGSLEKDIPFGNHHFQVPC